MTLNEENRLVEYNGYVSNICGKTNILMTAFRISILILGGLVIVASVAFLLVSQDILVLPNGAVEQVIPSTDRVTLGRKDLSNYEDLNGVLEYGDSVQVFPSSDGVLTYIADQGSTVSIGSAVIKFYRSVTKTQTLAVEQQIASAKLAVVNAELSLEHLKTPATEAQTASADSAVANAELALSQLLAPATEVQIASADSAVANAELALSQLLAPATEVQIASANASVEQAKSSVVTTQGNMDTSLSSLRIARKSYCDSVVPLDNVEWIYRENICPESNMQLSAKAVQSIKDRMISELALVNASSNLILRQENYDSAVQAHESASANLNAATLNLESLYEDPTDLHIDQAQKALDSVKKQRLSLDELPKDAEIAQANQHLLAAEEQRKVLDQAPSELSFIQAQASLDSANALLNSALAAAENLKAGYSSSVFMYGDLPAWRNFEKDMEPGEDIQQLKKNLIALGYGSYSGLLTDREFNTATSYAVKLLQAELGVPETGTLYFGDVIFLPGPSLVGFSSTFPYLGAIVNPTGPVLTLTPTERTEIVIRQEGGVDYNTESLQRVGTSIEVRDKNLVAMGLSVDIELPNEVIVTGKIVDIGDTAVIPQGNQSGDPYLELSILLDTEAGLPEWTGAPVVVSVTSELASGVLAAPVTGLLALLGGGYALEIWENGSTRLVPVDVGMYADGWVEVEGIEEGAMIVVPR